MREGIRHLVVDMLMLGGGLTLALLGAPLVDGRWVLLLLGVILVGVPVMRMRNLGPLSIPHDINKKSLKVRIDKDSCMGVASCVKLAPRVFKIDETELKSSFISSAPLVILNEKGATNQTILQAAMSCPYRAIVLEDEITGERVYP